ncbi:hypothetical protein MGYG_01756 [Nannizzia gypsea CBS 118893]|uniref:C2H2-type domain-containing protein n=1 Tax=Arthroderma gypseum (strain ATCC MYA-4604 / CBS 118893) TaxID=535722 RepID=E5R334_ARTGP|nr:hypothetical protein MGYG_01756 [Nannizzia gypsea CBS 118893]EFQ98738.1 hypothetical protein MGYG_01756 [Nannizzia gypsea CBS 118893]
MPSDLELLADMGFDPERAKIAVSKSGGLQGALEWLEANQDKSLEEIKEEAAQKQSEAGGSDEPPDLKPGEEPKSLVCNECGKRFRSQAQAEFHASKTEHVDFSESTEEIAPLTEEEKKAKLEDLRQRLAEKRQKMSEQDKQDQKRNEEIRRKSTKETQDMKEELQRKEQLKEAAKKKREKQEEVEAKARIKAKIEADKQARKLKAEKEKAEREGRVLEEQKTQPTPAAAPVASKPASAYTEARLRLMTPSGNVIKSFPVDTTLFEVAAALQQEGNQVNSFTQTFPKKVFNQEDFGATLKELGFVPSGSLIVG